MLAEEQLEEVRQCLQSNSCLAHRLAPLIPPDVVENLRVEAAEALATEGKYLANWDYPRPPGPDDVQALTTERERLPESLRPVPTSSTNAGLFGAEFRLLINDLLLQWVGRDLERFARSVRNRVGPTYTVLRDKLTDLDPHPWQALIDRVERLIETRIRQNYPPIALTVLLWQQKLLERWCDPEFVCEADDGCIIERFDISTD